MDALGSEIIIGAIDWRWIYRPARKTFTRYREDSMNDKLVECVANFSEARRPHMVEEIIEAITSVSDVILLDQHSDEDHNRTFLTFVGPPKEIEDGAFLGIAKALVVLFRYFSILHYTW